MTIRSLSQLIEDHAGNFTGETVSVGEVLEAFHERGFGFLLLIFALPMALPLPVPPGINVLLATPLLILTTQQALGRHTIWMPQSIQKKSVSRDTFASMLNNMIPWAKRLEALIKPRLGFITQGAFSNLIGLLGLIMALTICIPLPLTNTIPSLGIALMAIGVIMRDGLTVIIGAAIGTAWVSMLTYALVFFGAEGLDMIKDAIKSMM